MKKMPVVVGIIAVTGILNACGGSSSKSTSGGDPGPGTSTSTTVAAPVIAATPTAITTKDEAAKTVNVSKTLATSFASSSSFPSLSTLVGKPASDQAADAHRIISTVLDMKKRVASLVDKQKSLGKQVAAAQSQACPDGGSMSFDASSNPVVMTFSGCKEGYEYKNGTVTLPQSALSNPTSGSGFSLSANMTTVSYHFGAYTTKEHEEALNVDLGIGSFNATTGAANLTINGSESKIDYILKTSEKQSFGNFSLNMTESTSGSSTTVSMTLNGSVSMDSFNDTTYTTIDTASGMTFQTLALVETVNSANSSSSLTIDGKYAMKTIPACMDGTFTISTQIPITTTGSGVTSGKMTVNGVVMVFNADGTVTATINGVPQTITSYANVCSLSF